MGYLGPLGDAERRVLFERHADTPRSATHAARTPSPTPDRLRRGDREKPHPARQVWRVGTRLDRARIGMTLHKAVVEHTSEPAFEVDPLWPRLPQGWTLGQVSGLDVDARDHVWIIHRPWSASANRDAGESAVPAPPVIEFDAAGQVVQAWGGPGPGYEWPADEHTIHVDGEGHVWLSSAGGPRLSDGIENQILKFTSDGRFLLQVGRRGRSKGSLDPDNFNNAADIFAPAGRHEVFVADGYLNRRVIVLDAETGACRRFWGAFGNVPDDAAPNRRIAGRRSAEQFNVVHGVRVSTDGLVYVADRLNDRIQIFTVDGRFQGEHLIDNPRPKLGAVVSLAFSPAPAQSYLLVADADAARVRLLERRTLTEVAHVGTAGLGPGAFAFLHNVAMDSKGNVYTSEIVGRRVQRFRPRHWGLR